MTVPRKPKPRAGDEVARVLTIYEMLEEEISRRQPVMVVTDSPSTPTMVKIEDIRPLPPKVDGGSILAVAERIASRTEGI